MMPQKNTLYLVLTFRVLPLAFFSGLALTERNKAKALYRALHKAYSDEVSSLNSCDREAARNIKTGRNMMGDLCW